MDYSGDEVSKALKFASEAGWSAGSLDASMIADDTVQQFAHCWQKGVRAA